MRGVALGKRRRVALYFCSRVFQLHRLGFASTLVDALERRAGSEEHRRSGVAQGPVISALSAST